MIMNSSIPVCFYPMKKIIIDDDVLFTQSMLLKLYANNFTSNNSAKECLNYLLNEYKPILNKAELIINNSSDSSTMHNVNFNIDKIKTLMIKPPLNDISVLLIDYHMPEINGIDFLTQIKHLPIKKL